MFKMPVIYVEDKNLGVLLRAMDGLAYMEGAPVPVRDAVVKRGKVQSNGKGGTAAEVVLRAIQQSKLKLISRLEIGEILQAAGHMSKSAPEGVIEVLVRKRKLLKRIKRGEYQVLTGAK